jgi:hypothetical protein
VTVTIAQIHLEDCASDYPTSICAMRFFKTRYRALLDNYRGSGSDPADRPLVLDDERN